MNLFRYSIAAINFRGETQILNYSLHIPLFRRK